MKWLCLCTNLPRKNYHFPFNIRLMITLVSKLVIYLDQASQIDDSKFAKQLPLYNFPVIWNKWCFSLVDEICDSDEKTD